MSIKTRTSNSWPLSEELVEILKEVVGDRSTGCIINFRSPKYSAEGGGFHPVEIMINSHGQVQYVTDFSFAGRAPHTELVKEIDFDFGCGTFLHFGREFPIYQGLELFLMWMDNFTMFYRMGVFEMTVEEI